MPMRHLYQLGDGGGVEVGILLFMAGFIASRFGFVSIWRAT